MPRARLLGVEVRCERSARRFGYFAGFTSSTLACSDFPSTLVSVMIFGVRRGMSVPLIALPSKDQSAPEQGSR